MTHVPQGKGETVWMVGTDLLMVLPGGGPPPRTHRREDEAFYVL